MKEMKVSEVKLLLQTDSKHRREETRTNECICVLNGKKWISITVLIAWWQNLPSAASAAPPAWGEAVSAWRPQNKHRVFAHTRHTRIIYFCFSRKVYWRPAETILCLGASQSFEQYSKENPVSLLSHPPFLPLSFFLHHSLLSSSYLFSSSYHLFFPSLTAASSPLGLILVVSMWTKSYFWILSFFFFFLFWIPPRVSSSSSSSSFFSSTDAFLYLKCRQLPSIACGGIKGFGMWSDPGRRLGVIISTWLCDETHSRHREAQIKPPACRCTSWTDSSQMYQTVKLKTHLSWCRGGLEGHGPACRHHEWWNPRQAAFNVSEELAVWFRCVWRAQVLMWWNVSNLLTKPEHWCKNKQMYSVFSPV